jgi:hypothetical protein
MPNIINPSAVNIRKIDLIGATGTFDLTANFLELNVYENIFQPALTAHITIADSFSFPAKLPIVGEETLDIIFSLEGVEDDGATIFLPPMHINEISSRFMSQPKSQQFSLELVSEQFMNNAHSTISKSYRGKTVEQIVQDIYSSHLDDEHENSNGITTESTDGIENIIIPNLHPHDAIRWLSQRTRAAESNAINFIYYETMSGSRFVSINKLVEQEHILTFTQSPAAEDPFKIESLSAAIVKYDKLNFVKQFDKYVNTKRGLYASKLITHDIVKKKIVQHEYQGFNEWFGISHLGIFPPLSNSETEIKKSSRKSFAPPATEFSSIDETELGNQVDSHIEFYPKHNQMYSLNTGDIYDNKVEDWKLQRNSHMEIYNGLKVMIECAGVSFLKIGSVVKLLITSPETTDRDGGMFEGYDQYLSGKWLVSEIRHILTQGDDISYRMVVTLLKDGLEAIVPLRETRKED